MYIKYRVETWKNMYSIHIYINSVPKLLKIGQTTFLCIKGNYTADKCLKKASDEQTRDWSIWYCYCKIILSEQCERETFPDKPSPSGFLFSAQLRNVVRQRLQPPSVPENVFLVWLLFYGPSTHFMSFRVRSVTLINYSWASLLGSLPVLSAHSFTSNWQLLFLNQRKRENGRRIFFMTKFPRKNVPVAKRSLRVPPPHSPMIQSILLVQ